MFSSNVPLRSTKGDFARRKKKCGDKSIVIGGKKPHFRGKKAVFMEHGRNGLMAKAKKTALISKGGKNLCFVSGFYS